MHQLVENVVDQLRGAWRFRWPALAVAWLVCLAGWAAVIVMPDVYEASARVFVDTRTTLGQVTQGIAVESNVGTQIQRVRQALLGGPQLEKVANEANLQAVGLTPQKRQEQLAKLRDSIQIVGSGASSKEESGGLYVISYRDGNRAQGLRVVDRLLNNFVENTRGGKREGSEQAQRFLVEQIQEYERRLSTAEARRAEFKKQNVGLMPGAQGGYFTRLQTEMESSTRAQGLLNIALRRRDELQRQLRGEQPILSGSGTSIPVGGANAPTGGNNDTASRIREAQNRLDELLLRFTDKHPDVVALRNTLAELQARQQQEIEAVRRGDPGAAAGIGLNANPVFQNIQLDLNRANVEIAALRGEVATHLRTIAELRKLVDTAPEVEAEFAKLDRDYDVTNAQYKALVERLERARLSEQAEETGIVTFEVVDPPTSPFTPVSPNRRLLVAVILGLGLGAGAALAYLLHQLKPVFTTSRQLNEVTGLPVLGVVSMTGVEEYLARARRGFLVYAGAAALLPLTAIAVLLAQGPAMRLLHQLMG